MIWENESLLFPCETNLIDKEKLEQLPQKRKNFGGKITTLLCFVVFFAIVVCVTNLFYPTTMVTLKQKVNSFLSKPSMIYDSIYNYVVDEYHQVACLFSDDAQGATNEIAIDATEDFVIPADDTQTAAVIDQMMLSQSSLPEETESDLQKLELLSAGGDAAQVYFADQIMYPPVNTTYAPADCPQSYTLPLVGPKTSNYGFRIHPIELDLDFHRGIDIAGEQGADIVAFADGVVSAVGNSKTLGKYIEIAHENGFVSVYGHCSKIIKQQGDRVKEGQMIAKVGSTGLSTGPHLHFAVKKNGVYHSPERIYDT